MIYNENTTEAFISWAKITPASEYINMLVEKSVIKGYEDGTFKPNNTISRAEFVTLVVKSLDYEITEGQVYEDIKEFWGSKYVSTAIMHGFIENQTTNTFRPNDTITREEMTVIVMKALKIDPVEGRDVFADEGDFDIDSLNYAVAAQKTVSWMAIQMVALNLKGI